MANLQPHAVPALRATNSLRPTHASQHQRERVASLMRKYEVRALMPDGTISDKQVIAPAIRTFEDTSSAFARGTLISTPRGPVAIEDLWPGDTIDTCNGSEPVVWIGSTTFVPNTSDQNTTLTHLCRITSESYGFGRPLGDILVGPAARMTVRRPKLQSLIGKAAVLAPVMDFCDGDRIIEVTPPGSVQLFHIALARHGTLSASGLDMETYHPGRSINAELGPNMRDLFLSMFPNIQILDDFGELTMTRTSREVIDNLAYG